MEVKEVVMRVYVLLLEPSVLVVMAEVFLEILQEVAVVAIMVAAVVQVVVAVVVVAIPIQPYVALWFTRKVLRLVWVN